MERLNEQQIELIKGLKGTANPIDLERYQLQMNDNDYGALTGIDLKTLKRMYGETSIYFEVRYCKCGEHFEVQYTTFIENLSGAFECDDFLELFSTKEEKQTVEDFFNDNMEEVVRKLKECYSDVVACLKEEIMNDLTADDVPDSLKEDIAYDWIEYNPNEACDKALDNMSSSDMSEVAKDIIDRL